MIKFTTFFTDARLGEFWHYVKYFLFVAAPLAMIVVALMTVHLLVKAIVKFYKRADQEEDLEYRQYRYYDD
ncbi:hypothetical protein SB724_19220 [Bacillus sp. SIMBA_031]